MVLGDDHKVHGHNPIVPKLNPMVLITNDDDDDDAFDLDSDDLLSDIDVELMDNDNILEPIMDEKSQSIDHSIAIKSVKTKQI